MVVNKDLSFDKKLKGDFNLEKNLLSKGDENQYIYTGCQILNRNLLKLTDDNHVSCKDTEKTNKSY